MNVAFKQNVSKGALPTAAAVALPTVATVALPAVATAKRPGGG